MWFHHPVLQRQGTIAINNWWCFYAIYLNYLSVQYFPTCNIIPKGLFWKQVEPWVFPGAPRLPQINLQLASARPSSTNECKIFHFYYCFIASCPPLLHLIEKWVPSIAEKAYENYHSVSISSSFSLNLSFVLGKWISMVSNQNYSIIAVQTSATIWHTDDSAIRTISPIVQR